MLDRWQRREFRWASWDSLGRTRRSTIPIRAHLERVLEIVDVAAIRRAGSRSCSTPATAPAAGWGRPCSKPSAAGAMVLGGEPDGRYDHPPEPTEANLKEFAAIVPAVGAAVGFAQDPDADRLAIVDETGRYIGEELTLALAAWRRLQQAKGPVVLNLSTSRVTEDLASRLGCPVLRTPVGEINVVERMLAENARAGRRGKRRRDRPAGRLCPRQFRGDGAGPRPAGGDGRAAFAAWCASLPRYAMIKDQYPLGEERGEPDRAGSADVTSAPLGPDRGGVPGRAGRPARRTAARLGRPLGARSSQQHRADRPSDRRGRRASRRPRAGRPDRPLGRRGAEGLP